MDHDTAIRDEIAKAGSPLCATCRNNELRRFILAGKPTEDRGCRHHYPIFPTATDCPRYEREPGTDA